MTVNTEPIFLKTAIISNAQIATINTGRDGTGTLGSVCTGATDGTRIHKITIKATVTTTAGMVRLFIDNLTNIRLWKEIEVPAITVSATVKAFEFVIYLPDQEALVLPSGYILKAGTEKAETFNVVAEGGNFS